MQNYEHYNDPQKQFTVLFLSFTMSRKLKTSFTSGPPLPFCTFLSSFIRYILEGFQRTKNSIGVIASSKRGFLDSIKFLEPGRKKLMRFIIQKARIIDT